MFEDVATFHPEEVVSIVVRSSVVEAAAVNNESAAGCTGARPHRAEEAGKGGDNEVKTDLHESASLDSQDSYDCIAEDMAMSPEKHQEAQIKLLIDAQGGGFFHISVSERATVLYIKCCVAEKMGMPEDNVSFRFNRQALLDDHMTPVDSLGVESDDVLEVEGKPKVASSDQVCSASHNLLGHNSSPCGDGLRHSCLALEANKAFGP